MYEALAVPSLFSFVGWFIRKTSIAFIVTVHHFLLVAFLPVGKHVVLWHNRTWVYQSNLWTVVRVFMKGCINDMTRPHWPCNSIFLQPDAQTVGWYDIACHCLLLLIGTVIVFLLSTVSANNNPSASIPLPSLYTLYLPVLPEFWFPK
jgi:hypothetical protein